jgi:hypothetical protein
MTTERFSNGSGGYSAKVGIRLLVGEASFDVAQVGGGRLIFAEPITLPRARGEVVLAIDGHVQRWAVSMRPVAEATRVVEAEFDRACGTEG